MKKSAVIALIFLLVTSLATSGYLLIDRRSSQAQQAQSSDSTEKATEQLKKANTLRASLETDLAAAKKALSDSNQTFSSQITQLQVEISNATNRVAELMTEIQTAESNNALTNEIATLKSNLTQHLTDYSTDTNSIAQLKSQLNDQTQAVTDKQNELDAALKVLENYKESGLTPEQIAELKKTRPVNLDTTGIERLKPVLPGKIRNPIPELTPTIPATTNTPPPVPSLPIPPPPIPEPK